MEQVIEFPLDVSKIFFILQPHAFRRQQNDTKDFTLMLDIDVNTRLIFKYHVGKKTFYTRGWCVIMRAFDCCYR